MKKLIFVSVLLLTACNHYSDSVETVDAQQGIYHVNTKDRDRGILKTVEDNDICPNLYTVLKVEPKIQEEHGPIFYNQYTIKCLPKLLADMKKEE